MTFQFDTSGVVILPAGEIGAHTFIWSDLSPFTQGYVEAMFASSYAVLPGFMATADQPEPDRLRTVPVGFSDLAPETLARIIADCEVANRIWPGEKSDGAVGRHFWVSRQAGGTPAFPPLTVQLGDDGKVRVA